MCNVAQEHTYIKTKRNTTGTSIKETIGEISKMTVTASVFLGIASLMVASAIGEAIMIAAIKLKRDDAGNALGIAFVNQKVKAF